MEKKRENPYKSKGRPTVIGLAKHRVQIALKDQEIEELKTELTYTKINRAEAMEEVKQCRDVITQMDKALTDKQVQILRLRGELEEADKEANAASEYIKCLLK